MTDKQGQTNAKSDSTELVARTIRFESGLYNEIKVIAEKENRSIQEVVIRKLRARCVCYELLKRLLNFNLLGLFFGRKICLST